MTGQLTSFIGNNEELELNNFGRKFGSGRLSLAVRSVRFATLRRLFASRDNVQTGKGEKYLKHDSGHELDSNSSSVSSFTENTFLYRTRNHSEPIFSALSNVSAIFSSFSSEPGSRRGTQGSTGRSYKDPSENGVNPFGLAKGMYFSDMLARIYSGKAVAGEDFYSYLNSHLEILVQLEDRWTLIKNDPGNLKSEDTDPGSVLTGINFDCIRSLRIFRRYLEYLRREDPRGLDNLLSMRPGDIGEVRKDVLFAVSMDGNRDKRSWIQRLMKKRVDEKVVDNGVYRSSNRIDYV